LYKPVLGNSKLDNHLLLHQQKKSSKCYYCKRNEFLDYSPTAHTQAPSLPKNFETYQQKSEHLGQHSDCEACMKLAVPSVKMMEYQLPRASKEKKYEIPQRSLGTGNHVPKFQNNSVADLDFIHYRKTEDPAPQEIVRLQNYSNYQSVCLSQNIDDLAIDVQKTNTHLNSLHTEISELRYDHDTLKHKIDLLLDKILIIEEAVSNMRHTYDESVPSSPKSPTGDANFSFFADKSSSKSKQLVLKAFSVNPPNFTLVRIEEVRQLAQEKLTIVQQQISSLESAIKKAKVDQLTEQLASVDISSTIIKMVDVKPEQPESSSQPSPTSAWEQWCNARFASRNKAPMDIDGQGQTSSKVGNFATAPVSNLDCKDKAFIESMIQEWHAWTKTQKMLQKEKVSWSDLALRLTWGFRGNLNFWWERVSDTSKLRILQHDKPVNELCKAVVHEFYGDNYVDTEHNADLFMS